LQYTFSRLPHRMWALVVMFFRFVTSGEIRRRAEFFEPFIQGMSNMSVVQVSVFLLLFLLLFIAIPIMKWQQSCF
jgi:hypothetical protein